MIQRLIRSNTRVTQPWKFHINADILQDLVGKFKCHLTHTSDTGSLVASIP